jgi:hypothetical protein
MATKMRLPALGLWSILALPFATPLLVAQSDVASSPARESHQGVTIAVRPLVSEKSYQDEFGKPTPFDSGILALQVFLRNDNDKPIRINLEAIRLLVNRSGQAPQRIGALSPEAVADAVLLKAPQDPGRPRLPFPIGGGSSNRSRNWQQFSGKLRGVALNTDILGPNSSHQGFLYFDISNHYDWLAEARLDVPDMVFMVDNQALFFFQVELAPALR